MDLKETHTWIYFGGVFFRHFDSWFVQKKQLLCFVKSLSSPCFVGRHLSEYNFSEVKFFNHLPTTGGVFFWNLIMDPHRSLYGRFRLRYTMDTPTQTQIRPWVQQHVEEENHNAWEDQIKQWIETTKTEPLEMGLHEKTTSWFRKPCAFEKLHLFNDYHYFVRGQLLQDWTTVLLKHGDSFKWWAVGKDSLITTWNCMI